MHGQESVVKLRPDYRKIATIYGDRRSGDRIIAHYELERRLAAKMRQSNRDEREQGLYTQLYDALLSGLDDHPRKKRVSLADATKYISRQVRMIKSHIRPDDVFLEIGGGDCKVALAVAPMVKRSVVLDVTDELVPQEPGVDNFEFVKTSGVHIPMPDESVSFVYSNQLMEHLHPQDALEQLNEVFRVLKPGGRYLCRTPNRLTGPHDVSKYFDDEPTGMHIREYTYGELDKLFHDAGFRGGRIVMAPRALYLATVPRFLVLPIEAMVQRIPRKLHTAICRSAIVRALMGITMIANKPAK